MNNTWVNITPQFIGVSISVLTVLVTIVWKFAIHDKEIKNHCEQLDEVHAVIENFHGKCDNVNETLTKTISWDMLKNHCRDHQEACSKNFCQKIEGLREDLKDTKNTVSKNHETMISALSKIEGFMGGIAERNKMIDNERARRTSDR